MRDRRIKGAMSAYHAVAERLAKTTHDILRELSHFMRKPERGGSFPHKKSDLMLRNSGLWGCFSSGGVSIPDSRCFDFLGYYLGGFRYNQFFSREVCYESF